MLIIAGAVVDVVGVVGEEVDVSSGDYDGSVAEGNY